MDAETKDILDEVERGKDSQFWQLVLAKVERLCAIYREKAADISLDKELRDIAAHEYHALKIVKTLPDRVREDYIRERVKI